MLRRPTTVALLLACLLLALPASAQARGGDDDELRTSGSCGGGARSELRLEADDGTIELRFEVRGARRGSWRVVVVAGAPRRVARDGQRERRLAILPDRARARRPPGGGRDHGPRLRAARRDLQRVRHALRQLIREDREPGRRRASGARSRAPSATSTAAGVFGPLMPRVACALLTIALVVALLADATRADARSRAPQLTGVRCVPSSAVGCRAGVKVKIGAQVQLRGTRLVTGMRVTFRWPRGALATRLKRSKVGWVARVPAGTGLGPVNVTVRDRARRRSRAVNIPCSPPRCRATGRCCRAGRCPRRSRGRACGSGT